MGESAVGQGIEQMTYTTKEVRDKFGLSRETIRQYSNNFSAYLSPTAKPEKGQQRNFTDDDLPVLALIATMKAAGADSDTIAAALAAGQRGVVPSESQIALPSDAGSPALKRKIIHLTQEYEAAQSELLMTQGENRLLKQQLADKERAIRELYRELARLEAAQDDE